MAAEVGGGDTDRGDTVSFERPLGVVQFHQWRRGESWITIILGFAAETGTADRAT